MAFRRRSGYDPSMPLDGQLGLLMRLNTLWSQADQVSLVGDFAKWNFILDRVFVNLLYKNELEPEKNKKGEIIGVKLSEEDQRIFDVLNNNVIKIKDELNKAKKNKNREEYVKKMNEFYNALMVKDAGCRKFQHKLKIYTKEFSSNPGKAMWGG